MSEPEQEYEIGVEVPGAEIIGLDDGVLIFPQGSAVFAAKYGAELVKVAGDGSIKFFDGSQTWKLLGGLKVVK